MFHDLQNYDVLCYTRPCHYVDQFDFFEHLLIHCTSQGLELIHHICHQHRQTALIDHHCCHHHNPHVIIVHLIIIIIIMIHIMLIECMWLYSIVCQIILFFFLINLFFLQIVSPCNTIILVYFFLPPLHTQNRHHPISHMNAYPPMFHWDKYVHI